MPRGRESTQRPQSGSSQGLQPGPGLSGAALAVNAHAKGQRLGHQGQLQLDGKGLLGWRVPTGVVGGLEGQSRPSCLLNGWYPVWSCPAEGAAQEQEPPLKQVDPCPDTRDSRGAVSAARCAGKMQGKQYYVAKQQSSEISMGVQLLSRRQKHRAV